MVASLLGIKIAIGVNSSLQCAHLRRQAQRKFFSHWAGHMYEPYRRRLFVSATRLAWFIRRHTTFSEMATDCLDSEAWIRREVL